MKSSSGIASYGSRKKTKMIDNDYHHAGDDNDDEDYEDDNDDAKKCSGTAGYRSREKGSQGGRSLTLTICL